MTANAARPNTGCYAGGNRRFAQVVCDQDYYIDVNEFRRYCRRFRNTPYTLLIRRTRGDRNIALGYVTNYRRVRNVMQVNRYKRFPQDGMYVNLSRGYICRRIRIITAFLNFGLYLRTKNAVSLKKAVRLIKLQYGFVIRKIREMREIIKYAITNEKFSHEGVCNRQSFEKELGLTWIN